MDPCRSGCVIGFSHRRKFNSILIRNIVVPIATHMALGGCGPGERNRSDDNNPCKAPGAKQQLIERLQEDAGPEERERIEQLLAKINRALDLLEGAGLNGSD
jgi:hypothetical protein